MYFLLSLTTILALWYVHRARQLYANFQQLATMCFVTDYVSVDNETSMTILDDICRFIRRGWPGVTMIEVVSDPTGVAPTEDVKAVQSAASYVRRVIRARLPRRSIDERVVGIRLVSKGKKDSVELRFMIRDRFNEIRESKTYIRIAVNE